MGAGMLAKQCAGDSRDWLGPAICMGIASLGMLWPKLSRVRPGSLLSMLFELEVLLTWARELRLEYEVGS